MNTRADFGIPLQQPTVDNHSCELNRMAALHLNEREHTFALDVGCGAGKQSIRLAQHGASVLAIDVRDMSGVIGSALAGMPGLTGQVTFTQCDMRQLHELPILILADVIVCQRAIDCLPYLEAVNVVSAMSKLLAPCGRLYLSASGASGCVEAHAPVCVYTETDLAQLLMQGGLHAEAVFTSDCGTIKAVARHAGADTSRVLHIEMRAWHVSPHHIVAAQTPGRAISYSHSIGLDEKDGLFTTAKELSESELSEPCWTGAGEDHSWRQETIAHFLADTTQERLLCEMLPAKSA